MMQFFKEILFHNFWTFLGCFLILGSICTTLYYVVSIPFKASVIKKKGYPPPHCDVLGDLKSDDKDNKD